MFERKAVPGATQAELAGRAQATKLRDWTAKRFPWIHIISMCESCNSNYKVLDSANARWGYTGGYETNDRPWPTVTDVQIKKQGELGTTKKATIKLIAYTDDQVVELQKCYFIPSMSVRVQWGWSVDINGNPPPPVISDTSLLDNEATKLIKNQAASSPCYDGIQGIVSSFSYNLLENNTWDCDIEIISAAEALMEVKTDAQGCKGPKCSVEKKVDEETKKVESSRLFIALQAIAMMESDPGKRSSKQADLRSAVAGANINPDEIFIDSYEFESDSRDPEDGSSNTIASWFSNSLGAGTLETFISWAGIEALINQNCMVNNSNKWITGTVASGGSYLTHHPSLDSTNAKVCVIPGTQYLNEYLMDEPVSSGTAIAAEGVNLALIRVNAIFAMLTLIEVEKGDGKIVTFLMNLLDGINQACGSLWEFIVVQPPQENDETKSATIMIADLKMPGYPPPAAYSLPANGAAAQSVLRSFKLDMKLTDGMKTQAIYANAGSSNSKDNCTGTVLKPFGLGLNIVNTAAKKPDELKPCPPCTEDQQPVPLTELMENAGDGHGQVDCDSAAARLSSIYKGETDESGTAPTPPNPKLCEGIPLPFEFSFTLDGIGGFGWGQVVTCDRIPPAVANGYEWQVTTAEHSITINDWVTTVNTIARTKP